MPPSARKSHRIHCSSPCHGAPTRRPHGGSLCPTHQRPHHLMPPGKRPAKWGTNQSYMKALKQEVRDTYGEHCWLCLKWIPPHQFSIDHVRPKSTHPHLTWELGNMRPCHLRCNKVRGTRSPERARQLLTRKELPRPIPKPSRDW
jgi:5-methylcytosine-specific restriction endonuclease McrA